MQKPYTYVVAGNMVAIFKGESQLGSYDEIVDELNQQAETIASMSESWQKLADMLGVEVRKDGLDVDRVAEAVEAKNAALREASVALGDWITTYAPEFCDHKDVDAARARIQAGQGTLYHIATIKRRVDKALAAGEAGK